MVIDPPTSTCILEARQLLDAMEEALRAMEEPREPGRAVGAVFRAVHGIRGSAGPYGMDGIVHFTHTMEDVLERVRGRALQLSADMIGLMLGCHGQLGQLLSAAQGGRADAPGIRAGGERILGQLAPLGRGRGCWHLSIRFGPELLRDGLDPIAFIRYLGTLGRIVHLAPLLGQLPEGAAFDPETCYLGLELDLDGSVRRSTLEEALGLLQGSSRIRLSAPQAGEGRTEQVVPASRNGAPTG